jgi:hypothetical protein
MKMKTKEYWFPAKKYGWGWGLPCCWQGWLVYAVWFAFLCGGGIFLAPHSIGLYVVYTIFLGIAFFMVVFAKGEKPRWRWREDDR